MVIQNRLKQIERGTVRSWQSNPLTSEKGADYTLQVGCASRADCRDDWLNGTGYQCAFCFLS